MDVNSIPGILTLVRGLPGSGKSTFARAAAKRIHATHLEADMFQVDNGVYNFIPERVGPSHEWCLNTTKRLIASGQNVIVSNTFTTLWELQKYLDINAFGEITVYRCNANYGNIHNVPDHVLEKMKSRFEDYEWECIVP